MFEVRRWMPLCSVVISDDSKKVAEENDRNVVTERQVILPTGVVPSCVKNQTRRQIRESKEDEHKYIPIGSHPRNERSLRSRYYSESIRNLDEHEQQTEGLAQHHFPTQ